MFLRWQTASETITALRVHACLGAQSCPTLCNLMDCSPPGPSVHGVFFMHEYWCGWPFPAPGDLPKPGGVIYHCATSVLIKLSLCWIGGLIRFSADKGTSAAHVWSTAHAAGAWRHWQQTGIGREGMRRKNPNPHPVLGSVRAHQKALLLSSSFLRRPSLSFHGQQSAALCEGLPWKQRSWELHVCVPRAPDIDYYSAY